ncbi:MAG: glycosyltransferase family 2 protein [Candidatus Bathyarchaeia archaeon]
MPTKGGSKEILSMLPEKHRVSIIIPTLNEASAIESVLRNTPSKFIDEIIVVDSSDDDTPKIAETFGVKVIREVRRGYGRALQTGIENAGGDIIVFIDGDCTYDSRDIPRIIEPILNGECDVVLGDRLNGKSHPGAMHPINRLGNIIISLIFSIVFQKRINDTQCGLRAVRKQLLEGLSYREYGMPYATEQLAKLIKRKARIRSVPITYRPRVGETKLRRWIDGPRILKTILMERLSR